MSSFTTPMCNKQQPQQQQQMKSTSLYLLAVICSLLLALSAARHTTSLTGPRSQYNSELHYQRASISANDELKIVKHRVVKDALIGQIMTGHVITAAGAAKGYHTYIAAAGCPGVAATSVTSKLHGCKIATNAGFFDMANGNCLNSIVSDGEVIQASAPQVGGFGITTDGRMVIGYANQTTVQQGAFRQFVQGRGWLVKDGKANVAAAAQIEGISQSFVDLIAPRLAVGWDRDGNLMIFVINGVEREHLGIDLNTFAQFMIDEGAVEAVNLDGGGSVTLIWNEVICDSSGMHQNDCENMDLVEQVFGKNAIVAKNADPYQRPVTSIVCLK